MGKARWEKQIYLLALLQAQGIASLAMFPKVLA